MKKVNQISKNSGNISRRNFMKTAASGAATLTILPNFTVSRLGHLPPSDKLLIAAIGCGGEGSDDIRHYAIAPKKNAEIAFLCDVDDRQATAKRKEFPKATFYHDWREMFDKQSKNFDAVSVAIPDHNHAIAGLSAMQLRKHLYLQKPLTHDIYEARILTEASEKYQIVTQMGDQGASCDGMRTLREWIEADILGEIEKVYCWTDRPVWPREFHGLIHVLPYRMNSNGIFGWVLQKKPIILIIWFLSTGGDGGGLGQEHWAIWVVILWDLRLNYLILDIRPKYPAVQVLFIMVFLQKEFIPKADPFPVRFVLNIS